MSVKREGVSLDDALKGHDAAETAYAGVQALHESSLQLVKEAARREADPHLLAIARIDERLRQVGLRDYVWGDAYQRAAKLLEAEKSGATAAPVEDGGVPF